MISLKRFAIIAVLSLASCSSTPKINVLDAPLTPQVIQDLEGFCNKGNPFACYRLGSELDDKKNWGEAKVWFKKACDLHLGSACSEASVMAKEHLHEPEDAMKLARQACDLNDTLGCYNLGCYQCLEKSEPAKVFKSLDLAIKLGYRNLESLAHDPDLECVRKTKSWPGFFSTIPVEGKSAETHHYALMTASRHLFHPKLRFSYAAVPGFHIQYSSSGVLVLDDAGSRIYFTGSNQSFSSVVAAVNKAPIIDAKETEIHSEEGTVNGYRAYARVVKGTHQGLEYVASFYVTGDETYTVTAQATYLASFHTTYGPAILESAESIVMDPRGPPSAKDLSLVDASKIGNYRYAGLQNGNPIWTRSGSVPKREENKDEDTLVINSFIFTSDELFSGPTFERLWTSIVAQSVIQVPKLDIKKIIHQKTEEGSAALHFLESGQQIDHLGAKHEIKLEVGLVKLPKTAPLGALGFFWARVIQSHSPVQDSDTRALMSLKLTPEAIQEMMEMKTPEPEVTAPSVGNGAIPAS